MKPNALKRFRAKLAADAPTYGMWVTLESASITEIAVGLGLDWVVIDAEHGHLDWKEIVEHIRAAVRSDTLALVRISELNGALIKRVLDIGGDGLIIPWIETPEQLAQAVRFAHYPPGGLRGIGAERATAWGQRFAEHVAEADENVLVIPLIESVTGGRNVPQMLSVPGVDLFSFGPADYSATAGFAGEWEGGEVGKLILQAKDRIRATGRHCGIVATSNDNLEERRQQGFRMLGLGMDTGLMMRGLRNALQSVGRDQPVHFEFVCENDAAAVANEQLLPCPPNSICPDRAAALSRSGQGPQLEISPGVAFDCMVGAHNDARGLTTGLVRFAPSAALPYHRHTFGESVTLLKGSLIMEVEGRRYALDPLDNISIPAGLAHAAINRNPDQETLLHIAMASAAPQRELVDEFFSKRGMPNDSSGVSGGERVTRFQRAGRYQPGPNASFLDFCNGDLIPGFEMSCGYGIFREGGRLPAHLHDFDEATYVVKGLATRVVDGQSLTVSEFATAFHPRGRVHHLLNEHNAPLEVIWSHAGPQPLRIAVSEGPRS